VNQPAQTDVVTIDATGAGAIAFRYEGERRMTAGTLQRWTLRFAALIDLPAGARIAVAHRWPSDWGIAQASDPAGVDYLEAETSDGTSVRWWNARLHAWHPFDHIVFVELPDGLQTGESVELRYGEGRGGAPGYRVQTFIEEASPFSLRWQAQDGAPWIEFARHTVEVVGAEAVRLVVSAPSLVASGVPTELHLRVEDGWGNPARLDAPLQIELAGEGLEQSGRVTLPPCAWTRVPVVFRSPGAQRVEARTLGTPALRARSNPVQVSAQRPDEPLFWGDLHAQSVIGCGARSIDAYYAHARDFSATDFGSHQANCFLVSREEWQQTASSTQQHHAPRRFVTFLGVEWSGATAVGGDHNLYFPGDEAALHRCSHEFVADKSDADTDLKHVEDVYRHYRGSDTLVAVHVGGRTADLAWHEPGLDRLLEVHSTHATSEWFLFDALRRGYRMGVIAGSDGVDGRPGNSHPGHQSVRNVRGGLTALLAPELTRAALWKALKDRRCYATTGERILLDFRAGAARMGDAVVAGDAGFEVRVEGTAPLECIDFFRGTQCLRSIDCFADAGTLSNHVRIAWQGLSAPGNWQRARMNWDGELRVEGAQILAAEGWAFDTPDEGLRDQDRARVGWRSVTAGDWDGVLLELDRPGDAELWFVTGPMSLRTRLSQLGPGGRRFDAHNPQRCVEIKRLPERMPSSSFRGRFDDPSPIAGEQAYWVRVRQSDGAYAWSSPIFVTIG
jgi:Protein of unknown function (DUF3604)